MATTTEDGFHEIQLNGKHVVFLFMALTVVSVVIFLCGVLVGRGVRAQVGDLDTISAQTEPAAPDAAVPAAASSTGGPPAAAKEVLSYPNRLSSSTPAAEELKEPAPAPQKAVPPAATVADSPAAPAPAAAAAAASGEPAGDGFAIQVTALSQRAEADAVVRSLASKGYRAYLLSPASGAPAVYRVRVGKFDDRREAESVAAKLQKEGQFKPWIVR